MRAKLLRIERQKIGGFFVLVSHGQGISASIQCLDHRIGK
jgi:hypothetical protein